MTKHPFSPHDGEPLNPGNDTARTATTLGSALATGDDETADAVIDAAAVNAVIKARQRRSAHLPAGLFGDPAWDMLLVLLHAELTNRPATAEFLGSAANVGPEASRRWIDALTAKGLCLSIRSSDQSDVISLTAEGSRALRSYFAEVLKALPRGFLDATS